MFMFVTLLGPCASDTLAPVAVADVVVAGVPTHEKLSIISLSSNAPPKNISFYVFVWLGEKNDSNFSVG
jgi:hypothetical protein